MAEPNTPCSSTHGGPIGRRMAKYWPHHNADDAPPEARRLNMGRLKEFYHLSKAIAGGLAAAATMAIICHMMPATRSGDGNPWRQPPWYDPANETSYSFATYVQDIQLWLMMGDRVATPPASSCNRVTTWRGCTIIHSILHSRRAHARRPTTWCTARPCQLHHHRITTAFRTAG